MTPSFCDLKGSSSRSSWIGRASMSARRPSLVPGLPVLKTTTTLVGVSRSIAATFFNLPISAAM